MFELPARIRETLDDVRQRLRSHVWFEGVAKLIALVAIAFWLGLLIDWTFEPSPAVRQAGLILLAAVTLVQAYRLILRRAFVRLSDQSIANLLEHRFPELNDHVATAVDLTKQPVDEEVHPQMIARTLASAELAISEIQTTALFNRQPLVRAAALAVVLTVAIASFAALAPEAFGVWVRRIGLSDQQWPRRVQLEVVGFPMTSDGRRVQKVAQDDNFALEVHAMLDDGHVAPENVQLRFRLDDGRRGRDWFARVGKAVPGADAYQLFRYGFENVATDMTFDVLGGDDQVRDLHLLVVSRPELVDAQIRCEYPHYLARGESVVPISSTMRFPTGSKLMLEAATSKPIVEATVQSSREDGLEKLDFAESPQTSFRYPLGQFTEDDILLVDLLDLDSVVCRDPYRISLTVIPDEPPQLAVRLEGISTVVTPDAVIPIVGTITDDYGLESIWIEFQVDQNVAQRRMSVPSANGVQEIKTVHRLDLRGRAAEGMRLVDLRPGQSLTVALVAQDRYDLGDAPQTASSQQFALEVVTPEHLLALMERRELSLRQRFESLKEKLADTRDLLSRIEFATAEESDGSQTQQAVSRRELRMVGAMQNVMQTTQEVLGVAAAFDDLHAELVNNRIDNDELKGRLKYDIAEPLHVLGEVRLPLLDVRLQSAREVIDDPAEGKPRLDRAVQLCDQILVEMQQVLSRMLELESYNEVLSLLRDIITEQEQLREKTKDRQREKLRGVLDE